MCVLKIPIIAHLRFKNTGRPDDYHAVVISGYRQDKLGIINRLYVHDDQIGPYSRVNDSFGGGTFLKWSNEWDEEYENIYLNGLVLPLYPKIRLGYANVIKYVYNFRNKHPHLNTNLYITTVQKYKNRLVYENIENKMNVLRKPMPRFLWVINAQENQNNVVDILIDATSHTIRHWQTVTYR